MNKFKKYLNNLGNDKKDHLIVGVLLSSLIPICGAIFGLYGAIISFALGTWLALYKELYNDYYKKKGNPEVLDFVYTWIPLLITFIAYLA